MQNITKKFIASIVTISCAAMIAFPASAATVDELQAQIAALLAQIQALQTQLGTVQATTGTGTGACAGVAFSRTLKLGMAGTDVKCLQAILNQSADTQVSASGSGAPGYETTYFGAKTKAAVILFQQKYASEVLAPVGLTAGTGLVGAKTAAKLNTMIGVAAGTGTTGGTGTTVVLPTASGLTVAVAADNPIASTIISDGANSAAGSQALIPFLKLNFTTPAGTSAKVTTLKLKRLGVSSDTDLPNVYLYEGDTKLTEMTSLSSGVISFVNAAGLFTVSGVKTITVKADLYADASAGKTIGLGLVAVADVVTDASAVNGTFPINGNLMTTAVVTDFGRLTVATTTNSATVDPGTTGYEAMRITLAATNQKIKLYSIKLLQLGSIQKADIANLALYAGATQLGTTQAALASDGTVTFDLSSSPYEVGSGVTRTLSLKVDVIGGSTRTIRFSLQRSTDIAAMDSNYGVYVTPDTGTIATYSVLSSTAATVTAGNLTINRRSDSPSGNVALNSTNITLAKYDVKAVGEDIKISSLVVNVASSTDWSNIKNVRVLYDGYQVGLTTLVMGGTAVTIYPSFTVPVGQTKIIEIKADISSQGASNGLASADKMTASLQVGTSNAQRMTSLDTFAFPATAANGSELTVTTAALSASKNFSIGDITAVYNAQGITIGSWQLTAGSAEGLDISKIAFKDAASSTATSAGAVSLGSAFTNLELYYGATKLGATVVPNTADPLGTEYSFYPSSFSLVGGQTVRIDLKANVRQIGLTWTNGQAAQISSVESTGKVTTNSANINAVGAAAGQSLTLTGAGFLTEALDSSSPQTGQVALGQTAKSLAVWKVSASNIEDLTVSQFYVFNRVIASSSANVTNLTLYCGTEQFGVAQSGLIYSSALLSGSYYAAFGGATCVIPKGGNKLMTLKADITTYGNGGMPGAYLQFSAYVPTPITGVSTNEIVARGNGDYASTTARSTSTANSIYPYRTTLSTQLTCVGGCVSGSQRPRGSSDTVGRLTLTGTSFADAQFNAALNGADDAVITAWSTSTSPAGYADTNSVTATTSATLALDGGSAIRWYASSSGAGTSTFALLDMGTDLSVYSRISLWVYPLNNTVARTLFVSNTNSTSTAFILAVASTTSGTLTSGAWNRIELSLAGVTSSAQYVGLGTGAAFAGVDYIDSIKAYNESITFDVSGSTNTTVATGTAWYLKIGADEKAVGYYDGASKVVLIPSANIAVGSTPVALDLITNTTTMLVADTTAAETLNVSADLGNTTTAGDFRWYDQGVTEINPITWMDGQTPINVSLTY